MDLNWATNQTSIWRNYNWVLRHTTLGSIMCSLLAHPYTPAAGVILSSSLPNCAVSTKLRQIWTVSMCKKPQTVYLEHPSEGTSSSTVEDHHAPHELNHHVSSETSQIDSQMSSISSGTCNFSIAACLKDGRLGKINLRNCNIVVKFLS